MSVQCPFANKWLKTHVTCCGNRFAHILLSYFFSTISWVLMAFDMQASSRLTTVSCNIFWVQWSCLFISCEMVERLGKSWSGWNSNARPGASSCSPRKENNTLAIINVRRFSKWQKTKNVLNKFALTYNEERGQYDLWLKPEELLMIRTA